MEDLNSAGRRQHKLVLNNRKDFTISGVQDVLSFDEETVVLDTSLGRLTVKGSGLHIINFDTKSGDLSAEGRLYALVYTSQEKSGGVFSRIFR